MTPLTSFQLYGFKEFINRNYALNLLNLENEDVDDRKGIREMYIQDLNTQLEILKDITDNNGKSAYQTWECLDTAVRDNFPDYVINYLEQFNESEKKEMERKKEELENEIDQLKKSLFENKKQLEKLKAQLNSL
jgi:predicted RNase H-like nuclease (RuvC/YqgF family)